MGARAADTRGVGPAPRSHCSRCLESSTRTAPRGRRRRRSRCLGSSSSSSRTAGCSTSSSCTCTCSCTGHPCQVDRAPAAAEDGARAAKAAVSAAREDSGAASAGSATNKVAAVPEGGWAAAGAMVWARRQTSWVLRVWGGGGVLRAIRQTSWTAGWSEMARRLVARGRQWCGQEDRPLGFLAGKKTDFLSTGRARVAGRGVLGWVDECDPDWR